MLDWDSPLDPLVSATLGTEPHDTTEGPPDDSAEPDGQPAPREPAPRVRPLQADRAPCRPQAQAGARQRFAKTPDAAGPGGHRAGRAAPLLDRRAALQGRDAALAGEQ